ncbi:hypothetical protein [Saliphagus infecundisoli]|uniref:Uncharacterized protein n=1 Tax=Saliphagus infecundisoli TaxID=1849069 RepID=A0ABD5QIU6_9EURY|nr:hypothetical protein [Saliphagus infecundisoli]
MMRERRVKGGCLYDWCLTVSSPDSLDQFPDELARYMHRPTRDADRSGDLVTWELGAVLDGYLTRDVSRFVDRIQAGERLRLVRVSEHDSERKDYTLEIELLRGGSA